MLKLSDVIPQKYFIYIPDKLFLRLTYLQKRKHLPNTRNPKTFSEKISWIKMHGHLENYGIYADKLAVREYVKKTIGEKYLIPQLGSWDSFDEIPFKKLPKQFVIKANHGSGYNYICKDKSKLDKKDLHSKIDSWLNENFYELYREAQYKYIEPRILCEKYLEDEHGELRDYKFNCFDGKPEMIEVHWGRASQHKVASLNSKWHNMPFDIDDVDSGTDEAVPKPKNFNEMIKIAKKLAKDFPYVRVDLYSVNGKIFFGELSFTPLEGLPFQGKADEIMGGFLDLKGYRK